MRTIKCNASLLNAKTNQVKRVMWMCTHEFDNSVDFRELQRNFPVCKQNQERNDYIFDARSEFLYIIVWVEVVHCCQVVWRQSAKAIEVAKWKFHGIMISAMKPKLRATKSIRFIFSSIAANESILKYFALQRWIVSGMFHEYSPVQPNLVNSWREQAASHRQCVR